jgi:hypothetical protein
MPWPRLKLEQRCCRAPPGAPAPGADEPAGEIVDECCGRSPQAGEVYIALGLERLLRLVLLYRPLRRTDPVNQLNRKAGHRIKCPKVDTETDERSLAGWALPTAEGRLRRASWTLVPMIEKDRTVCNKGCRSSMSIPSSLSAATPAECEVCYILYLRGIHALLAPRSHLFF